MKFVALASRMFVGCVSRDTCRSKACCSERRDNPGYWLARGNGKCVPADLVNLVDGGIIGIACRVIEWGSGRAVGCCAS